MSNLQKFNGLIRNPKTQDYLADVLGAKKEQFITTLTSLVANNQALQECEPVTVMYAAIKSTALDLPLDNNLGFAYVIPYKNSKKGITEAQFQIGYKGFVQLALRTNQFETINVTDVRAGEIENHDRLTGELTFNWLSDEERAGKQILGYIAYFKLLNGFKKSLYMTKSEVEKHARKYSKSFNNKYGLWANEFDVMAKKTVLKLLLGKYAPMSIQLADAIKSDQAVIHDNEEIEYPDNDFTDFIDLEENNKNEEIDRISKFVEKANTIDELRSLKLGIPSEHSDFFIPIIDKKIKSLQKE